MFNLLKKEKAPASPPLPAPLHHILNTEFDDDSRVYALFKDFLQAESYHRPFAEKLLHIARGNDGAAWPVRRLATLMLQHQALLLPPDRQEAFDFLFTALNLKTAGADTVEEAVLKEGYSTTELQGFINEFLRKLGRHHRVLRLIQGRTTSAEAVRDFIHLSRQACKLALARYLFTPHDVVDHLLKHVKVSAGKKVRASHIRSIKHIAATLPTFETGILRLLCEEERIYWVSEATPSSVNALVEYPLTTVVLVVKPPGSEVEVEIKRAGRRRHPLNAVFMREDKAVPKYHRLDGGSKDRNLVWESEASSLFATIFRQVHNRDAPIGTITSINTTKTIPAGNRNVPLFDYFNEASLFGEGFDEMRRAMQQIVDAFRKEKDKPASPSDDDAGLTRAFLDFTSPGQAILLGTSSFRVDGLAAYLADDGPTRYFEKGLNRDYTPLDARRFADDLLDEVLDVYHPPDVLYQSHAHYLDAAFAVPENRASAGRTYRSLLEQIGVCWGTLLGIRGYSWGESFVARNVGLRKVWAEGRWTVKIIFMDHDNLRLKKTSPKDFKPAKTLRGMRYDERFILGRPEEDPHDEGLVYFLEHIYRVEDEDKTQGMAAFKTALRHAYRATQDTLARNAELQTRFHKTFVPWIQDWNSLVRQYLRARDDAASGSWRKEARALLGEKGYAPEVIEEHIDAIKHYGRLLNRYAFLYR